MRKFTKVWIKMLLVFSRYRSSGRLTVGGEFFILVKPYLVSSTILIRQQFLATGLTTASVILSVWVLVPVLRSASLDWRKTNIWPEVEASTEGLRCGERRKKNKKTQSGNRLYYNSSTTWMEENQIWNAALNLYDNWIKVDVKISINLIETFKGSRTSSSSSWTRLRIRKWLDVKELFKDWGKRGSEKCLDLN